MVNPFPEKRRNLLRLGVALAYLGLVSQHRVSLYSMNDHVNLEVRPLKGQGNIQKFIDKLSSLEFEGVTDLDASFREFRPGRQRYGIIFVVSDLFGQDAEAAPASLRLSASWPGEIHVIHLFHPRERNPELEGEIELLDVETQEKRRLWITPRERKNYRKAFATFVEEVRRECVSRQIDYVPWTTDQEFEEAFIDLLSRGSALASGS